MAHSPESLIERLQALATELGQPSVSRQVWLSHTQINEHHITKHFHSWNHFVISAGLDPIVNARIDDEVLFEEMLHFFTAMGGITTRTQFNREARHSADVYKKRWGRWESILMAFRDWASSSHPEFAHFDQLPLGEPNRVGKVEVDSHVSRFPIRGRPSSGGRRLGPPLNFRGLQHEPITELGVIFLFGMVARELGFIVEDIAASFPDCEAKREVSRGRWERVRIEFEFESRNFVTHGHNKDDVDIVVCWIDNWPDCPIEVVELKREIARLHN